MGGEWSGSIPDILIVGGCPGDFPELEAALSGLGIAPSRASGGEDALAYLEENEVAAVFLPARAWGLDFTRRLRGRRGSGEAPVLFLDGAGEAPDLPVEDAYALGDVDYLARPIDARLLRAKVAGLVERSRRASRSARAEAELRDRLSGVLATINDMVLTLDAELRYTSVSDRMVEVSGIPRDRLVGRRVREVFPDLADSLLERELLRALGRRTPVRFEFYHASYGRWFENRAFPSGDGLLLISTEVTEAKRAEEARRHLAAIVESSGDAIISEDLDGRITSWNEGARRLFGFAAEEVVGRPIALLAPGEAPEDSSKILEKIRRGESVEHYETRRRAKDGRVVDVSLTVSPIRDPLGAIVGASKIARDIGDRKRAEGRQRLLVEAGRVLGSSLDVEATLAGVCDLVVPGAADWCALDLVAEEGGLRRVRVAHRDPAAVETVREFRRLYPPDPDDPGGLMRVLRTGEPELTRDITDAMLVAAARDENHLRFLRGLGLRSALIVPLVARGRTLGALTMAMAESSRRFDEADLGLALELASRAALAVENARLFAGAHEAIRVRDEAVGLHREMEERLTLLVEASGSLSESLQLGSVLGAVLDLSGRLIRADAYAVWRHRAATGTWGIEHAAGLSEDFRRSTIPAGDATPAMPGTAILAEDVRSDPFLGARVGTLEREGVRSLMSVPLRVRGVISGSLVFYFREPHRFTEIEVRVATALSNLAGSAIGTSELYQELREADRRKDEFLAMLAHELRNPLSAISNAVRLARRTSAREDREWSEGVIERQSAKLARLVDDLLDVARITQGKVQLSRRVLDARPVIAGAVEAVRPLLEERGHELTVAAGDGPLVLEADAVRLEQILVNLLTNAAKYTPPGGHIRLGAEATARDIVFRVEDDGMGIAPGFLPTIFELFSQGERSIARSEGGLGIGLTLVRRLAEMHGGSASAASAGEGKGSVFTVRLPSSASAPIAEDAPGPGPAGDGRAARVLVIDDNVDAARGLARLLKLLGHEVRTADDGPSGIDAAREYRPDVVLLDIGLPGMDGYEVASRLRLDAGCREALIIAVTGYGQDKDRRRAREAGFDHHLVKPVDPDALVLLLNR